MPPRIIIEDAGAAWTVSWAKKKLSVLKKLCGTVNKRYSFSSGEEVEISAGAGGDRIRVRKEQGFWVLPTWLTQKNNVVALVLFKTKKKQIEQFINTAWRAIFFRLHVPHESEFYTLRAHPDFVVFAPRPIVSTYAYAISTYGGRWKSPGIAVCDIKNGSKIPLKIDLGMHDIQYQTVGPVIESDYRGESYPNFSIKYTALSGGRYWAADRKYIYTIVRKAADGTDLREIFNPEFSLSSHASEDVYIRGHSAMFTWESTQLKMFEIPTGVTDLVPKIPVNPSVITLNGCTPLEFPNVYTGEFVTLDSSTRSFPWYKYTALPDQALFFIEISDAQGRDTLYTDPVSRAPMGYRHDMFPPKQFVYNAKEGIVTNHPLPLITLGERTVYNAGEPETAPNMYSYFIRSLVYWCYLEGDTTARMLVVCTDPTTEVLDTVLPITPGRKFNTPSALYTFNLDGRLISTEVVPPMFTGELGEENKIMTYPQHLAPGRSAVAAAHDGRAFVGYPGVPAFETALPGIYCGNNTFIQLAGQQYPAKNSKGEECATEAEALATYNPTTGKYEYYNYVLPRFFMRTRNLGAGASWEALPVPEFIDGVSVRYNTYTHGDTDVSAASRLVLLSPDMEDAPAKLAWFIWDRANLLHGKVACNVFISEDAAETWTRVPYEDDGHPFHDYLLNRPVPFIMYKSGRNRPNHERPFTYKPE